MLPYLIDDRAGANSLRASLWWPSGTQRAHASRRPHFLSSLSNDYQRRAQCMFPRILLFYFILYFIAFILPPYYIIFYILLHPILVNGHSPCSAESLVFGYLLVAWCVGYRRRVHGDSRSVRCGTQDPPVAWTRATQWTRLAVGVGHRWGALYKWGLIPSETSTRPTGERAYSSLGHTRPTGGRAHSSVGHTHTHRHTRL